MATAPTPATAGAEPTGTDIHQPTPVGAIRVVGRRQRQKFVIPGEPDMMGRDEDTEIIVLLEKSDARVKYRVADKSDQTCGGCRFYDADDYGCSLVEGTIDPTYVCNLWTAPVAIMSASESFAIFTEGDFSKPGWIPFLPKPGVYDHPLYGQIPVTKESNQEMVDSVKNHVYQENIPLDAEHETKLSGAVAWIKDMRMNADSSADAFVDWTDRGRTLMGGGQFKYVSPEWFRQWKDPATGKAYRNVVAGGAITTRPFFKDKVLRALVAGEQGFEVIGAPDKFRDYSTEQRQEMAKKGWALPNLSFPIADRVDLDNAVSAFGLGKDSAAAKAHIIKRARALNALDALPDKWNVTASEGVRMAEPVGDNLKDHLTAAEPGGHGVGGGDLQENMNSQHQDLHSAATPAAGHTHGSANPFAGKEPEQVTLTAKEVEDRISAAVGPLQVQLEAAERLAMTERTAREDTEKQLKAMQAERRRERFVQEASAWIGDSGKHVQLLEALADTFGEDSDQFKAYAEQQAAVKNQLATSGLFSEFGRPARPEGDTPLAKLEALAKAKAAASDGKLTYAQAYAEVMGTAEGAELYQQTLKGN